MPASLMAALAHQPAEQQRPAHAPLSARQDPALPSNPAHLWLHHGQHMGGRHVIQVDGSEAWQAGRAGQGCLR